MTSGKFSYANPANPNVNKDTKQVETQGKVLATSGYTADAKKLTKSGPKTVPKITCKIVYSTSRALLSTLKGPSEWSPL